ncbi:Uu.00g126860.m01.CDS01 [Anthostomella pinea]|uniref:Uu.00g126860.m01.CDS01 n=1 Tax=Anthostomella pinea TaxID=933095 RepID=A0AAI8VI27_9PEZI|nr:Uu.00g126860.m01.CDS01 [Anthostomella pinea]
MTTSRASIPGGRPSNSHSHQVGQHEFVLPIAGGNSAHRAPMIPNLFLDSPPIKDSLSTGTSEEQDATARECVQSVAPASDDGIPRNEYGVPHLNRERHIRFLRKSLGTLPAPYVAADASRPWIFYWCLNGMVLLGADVSSYREDLTETARSMQNETGGFGGGFGQRSHLATTYALLLALAVVGGESAYEVIDRRAMWKWICSLKQRDGGFQMSRGGEVDVRGAYCAAVIITLLNLPLDLSPESPAWVADPAERPDLFTGLADYAKHSKVAFRGSRTLKPTVHTPSAL